jgi:hypothetical protein
MEILHRRPRAFEICDGQTGRTLHPAPTRHDPEPSLLTEPYSNQNLPPAWTRPDGERDTFEPSGFRGAALHGFNPVTIRTCSIRIFCSMLNQSERCRPAPRVGAKWAISRDRYRHVVTSSF